MSNLRLSRSYGCIPRSVAATALMLCFVAGFAPTLFGQKTKSDRKVLVSVKPEYSDFLRHAQIGGLVRLKATVTAEGKVTNVDVLGGNPILAESAVKAVMTWKYAPGLGQTVEEISLSFSPH
ncbi:MAG TPA: energy transducer TonB [Candidatus Sulfotelmatobacter sp.]|nr:energy transducer TonB [Candidatus Sulfotelmatobacter sp.]